MRPSFLLVLLSTHAITTPCGSSPSTPPHFGGVAHHEQTSSCAGVPSGDQPCSVWWQACLAEQLPNLAEELDGSEWRWVEMLAAKQLVAVRIAGDDASLAPACRIPGRYHEPVAAPDSPGRAWLADRLLFQPDELEGCETATHLVAAFAISEQERPPAQAVAVPLPCPPLGRGEVPRGCVGEGLTDDARTEAAERLAERYFELLVSEDVFMSTAVALEIAALLPGPNSAPFLAEHFRPLLRDSNYGGCLLLSEAEYLAKAYDPTYEPSIDLSGGRITPSRERYSCETRPSFSTCFPIQHKPGEGMNCW